MNIVVAMDKFKGSLDAPTACDVVRRAIRRVRPSWKVVTKPMADGGEGTARALIEARDGSWVSQTVAGPLERKVKAGFGWFTKERLAVVEMASASGIALLRDDQLDPLRTSTFGTGELIRGALDRGAKKIWLGVGGSATNDGGVGAAMALGWTFYDRDGEPIGLGGSELERIARIEPPHTNLVENVTVSVLCDVTNPLCGPNGAARVFGPQKGATPRVVERLDKGLKHLALVIRNQLKKNILQLPGAGAAGGLAGGAVAFLGAKLVPGIETIMQTGGLARELKRADWVITGEGRFDEQSLHGKVISGVTRLAKANHIRVAVLAGTVNLAEAICRANGIDIALGIKPGRMSLAAAMRNAEQLLEERAGDLVRFMETERRRLEGERPREP